MKELDSAIVSLLSLESAKTKVRPGGSGSSSARTYRVSVDGGQDYFVKTASGDHAQIMFAGEHASLNALANAVPGLAPRSHGHGKLQNQSGSFLVTDHIDMTGKHSSQSLAHKLATLHTTPAPIPEGYDRPQFGFPVPTCCGDTVQPNTYSTSWAEFFANNRLRFITAESVANQGEDQELEDVVERVCTVIPRLLGDDHLNNGKGVTPVVVHGDLWSGNKSTGKLAGMTEVEELVFDPSACYAHNEYDLGIMHMFGGFGGQFFSAYRKICPKTEPISEYDDRIALYHAYHHLNHYAMFGGGYRSSGLRLLKDVLRKYEKDTQL